MSRGPYRTTVPCAHPGCRETAHYEYDTRREEAESHRWRQDYPYRCLRHSQPDEVLAATNPVCTQVLIASKVEYLPGLFWRAEGEERGGNGLSLGPGFRAFASDFPEGTRLVVTATVELPGGAA